jgi:hypothetical protein
MRHVLVHLAVVVVGLGVAALAGVPLATALPIALIASCAVMMLTMGTRLPRPAIERARRARPARAVGRPDGWTLDLRWQGSVGEVAR